MRGADYGAVAQVAAGVKPCRTRRAKINEGPAAAGTRHLARPKTVSGLISLTSRGGLRPAPLRTARVHEDTAARSPRGEAAADHAHGLHAA